MKVSVIATVKNETESILPFLNSLLNQTKKPDEIIIVDGGSTDGTIEKIKKLAKKHKAIKLIVKKGANIAQGRNIAMENANGEVIAITDAGCIVDKNWLRNITKCFPKCDVVAGAYKPYYRNDFEYFQGLIVSPNVERIKKEGNMSSRSLALKKKWWKKVGGYPEDTYTGEDTLFNIKLKRAGAKFGYAKDAIVYWKMRPTWKSFAKQFYLYGYGDGKTGNIFKMPANALFFIGSTLIGILTMHSIIRNTPLWKWILLITVTILLYKSFQVTIISKNPKGLVYGPSLYILKRISYIVGVIFGLIKVS